ncbi:hypothetical protein ES703_06713 [subsurface metagenome]
MRRREDYDSGVKFTERALVALRTLNSVDRVKTRKAIESFYQNPDDPLIKRQVKELTDAPDFYVMRVTQTLRVILSYSGPTLIVVDIVRSDRLKKMWGGLK